MPWERLTSEALKYARVVDHYVYDSLGISPDRLRESSLHLFRAGGKRVRPLIAFLTARMLGGVEAESRAVPLASSIEVAHTFTLIHDDIMDQDDYRRGVPTVHKVYGVDWAILAGDLLHALAYKMVTESVERGLTVEGVYRALRALSVAAVNVSRGQAYDMQFEETWDVTPQDYLDMVRLKTGALMEAAARMGAVAAGAGYEVEALVGEYGVFVGVAFQIGDDLLGVYGDPKVTGKPVYNDLRRGKKTILVLKALEVLAREKGAEAAEEFKSMVGPQASEEELRRAAEIIQETGALSYAEKLAKSYSERARRILAKLPAVDEEARSLLDELAVFVVEREK